MPLRCARWSGSFRCSPSRCWSRRRSTRLPGFKKRHALVPREPARSGRARARSATTRRARHDAAGDPVARAAGAACCATMLDEHEFLSPYGMRSLSKVHERAAATSSSSAAQTLQRRATSPGESRQRMFGGNSNWRGPIWFPVNYLLIEALERYHHFYGDDLRVECPVGSGRRCTCWRSRPSCRRGCARLFLPDADGRRPCHGDARRVRQRPALARPGAVLRILPRRHGARHGRQPPDGMDGAGGAVSRVAGAPAGEIAQPRECGFRVAARLDTSSINDTL